MASIVSLTGGAMLLLKWVSRLTLILTLTVGIIIGVQRATHAETQSDWLDYSLCKLPCWRGITPGQTRFADSLKMLAGVKVQPVISMRINYWDLRGSGFVFHIPGKSASSPSSPTSVINGQIYVEMEKSNVLIGNPILGFIQTEDDESNFVKRMIFINFPDTRLVDLVDHIGIPENVSLIGENFGSKRVLMRIEFLKRRLQAFAELSSMEVSGLCRTGFANIPINSIVLYDEKHYLEEPYDWQPKQSWRGYEMFDDICNTEH